MRRLLSILLALSFSFPLLPQLAQAWTGDDLPACCRRDGKHQCGMAEARRAASSELALTKGRCAQFPSSLATVAERDEMLPAAERHSAGVAVSALAVRPEVATPPAPILFRENDRGPPVLL